MSIINVPYAYDIRYIPERSRLEKETVVYDTTPVIIREIKVDQAAVAIIAPIGADFVDYLTFDGRIYEPIPAAGPVALRPESAHPHNPFLGRSSPLRVERKDRDKIPSVTHLSIKEIVCSTRESGIADAQRRADELLLIDGAIYESCPGPVYSIVPPKSGRVSTLVSGSINDPHINLGLIFRADQREEAIDFAQDFYGKPPKVDCEAIIVTDRGVLPENFQEFSTRFLAEYALRRATYVTEIGKLPNDYIDAFLDYTEAANPADIDIDRIRGWIGVVSTSFEDSKSKDLAGLANSCGAHLDYLQRIEPARAIAP